MSGLTNDPFKGVGLAFRTFQVHFIIGTHKEFFKYVSAFKTSEFKDGHYPSPSFSHKHSHLRVADQHSRTLFLPGSGQDAQINGFPHRLDAVWSMSQTITIEEDKVKFPDSPSGHHLPANLNALLMLRNLPKCTVLSDEKPI